MKIFTLLFISALSVPAITLAQNSPDPSGIFGNRLLASISFAQDGEVQNSILTYNNENQLISISYNYFDTNVGNTTIDYTAGKIGTFDYDIIIKSKDYDETDTYYIKLNSDGFAGTIYTVSVDTDGTSTETATLEYNEHYQISKITKVENDKDTIEITIEYENVCISKITEKDGNQTEVYKYIYTNSSNPEPIDNVSGFAGIYDIDLDIFQCAYIAGIGGELIGLYLPVAEIEGTNDTITFSWTLDPNGYPTELTANDTNDPEDNYTMKFTWQEIAGINSAINDNDSEGIQYYSLSGYLLNNPVEGINIIRNSKGEYKKVLIH